MALSVLRLSTLRQEYSSRGLRRAELNPDPIKQFGAWLAEAIARDAAEPNAMTLATVDETGQPWTRTVLLKVCDERGFGFFTSYDGSKGRQLARSPRAAITFWWAPLERQVNITGVVSKTSAEESDEYFHSRPINSQLGAWASRQSDVLGNREELERKFAEVRERLGNKELPRPETWGGYRLWPETVEFWQGRASRLHDRFRYSRVAEDGWKIERLSP